MNQQNNIKRNYCLSRLILKTDSPKDEHHRDVYKVMKIISVTGNTVLNTKDIHFFSDSSEKKTGRFYLKSNPVIITVLSGEVFLHIS